MEAAARSHALIELARNADTFLIETVFLDEDKEIAACKRHLTAAQAESVARKAGVKRLVPFHFSPRYRDREDCLRRELEDAFGGTADAEGSQADAGSQAGRAS